MFDGELHARRRAPGAWCGWRSTGEEGFRLEGQSSMSQISRDPTELVGQTICKHHVSRRLRAVPAARCSRPSSDRGAPGQGFTHKNGDVVRVSTREARCARKQGDHLRPGPAVVVRYRGPDAQSRAPRPPEHLIRKSNMSDTKQLSHYIDGQWVAGAAASDSLNPSDTRDIVAKVPGGDKNTVNARGCRREGRVSRLGERQPRSALRPARQGRLADHGARRRSRPPAVARGRQDAARRQGRSHARRAHLQVLRRRSAAPPWRHGGFDASRRRGRDLSRAARRVRTDHAVEFPDRDSGLEERARAGLRQHRGHEARRR